MHKHLAIEGMHGGVDKVGMRIADLRSWIADMSTILDEHEN